MSSATDDPLSLLNLTRSFIIQRRETLTSLGSLPYHLIAPILKKLDSPLLLSRIETASPHLLPHTEPYWTKLITKEFGFSWIDQYSANSRTYSKLLREREKAKDSAKDALKRQFADLKAGKDGMTTKLVDAKVLPARKNRGPTVGRWDQKSGSRTKDIVRRSQREAREMSIFRSQKSVLARPMHELTHGRVGSALARKEETRKEVVERKGEKPPPPPPPPAKTTVMQEAARKIVKRKSAPVDVFMRRPNNAPPPAKRVKP